MMHSNPQSNPLTLPDTAQKEHGQNGVNASQETPKEVALPAIPTPTTAEAKAPSAEPPAPEAKAETKIEEATDKKGKKEKDKGTKMVYSDNQISPEEKMAKLPRYAFVPNGKRETVLGAVGPAVAGVFTGSDDVLDRTG